MTIKKADSGYKLESQKGKNLGKYPTKKQATKREMQVQAFKHMKKSGRKK